MVDSGEPSEMFTFFRKPTANKNIRKRKTQSTEQDDNTCLLSKKKVTAPADNKLRFSSSTNRASNKPESDAAEGEEESDVVFKFESSSSIQVENDNRATAVLETETEFDRDARAIRERVLKQAAASLKEGGKLQGEEEKLYKGIHGYKDYKAGFRREHTVASEKAGGAHGPLRTSAHIRVSARFDYQPDICKDYKETGYCGYGDSCKFMHDRGDYKSGWQLERDWDESEKERKRRGPLVNVV
ncbi:zinc finger CCCH domain-containing protein 1-like [Carex rostrata]